MNTNPYQPAANTDASTPPQNVRSKRLLIAGGVFMGSAFACILWTAVRQWFAYRNAVTHSSMPKPSDLAREINQALLPSFLAAPLGLIGLLMLILAFTLPPKPTVPAAKPAPLPTK